MVRVTGVRFKTAGKVYYFDPDNFELKIGDNVIVETTRGMEFGTVTMETSEVSEKEIVSPLKKFVRIANDDDYKRHLENVKKKEKALKLCQEKVDKHGLVMKLIDVEYTFDNSKIIFYFTADGRVDFRELVKDLAAVFKMRIELRQIGVRDEAKMMGGIGSCGRALCCHSWLSDFEPVSIKMAKVHEPFAESGQRFRVSAADLCAASSMRMTYTWSFAEECRIRVKRLRHRTAWQELLTQTYSKTR